MYSPAGDIQHLWVNAAKNGEWLHPTSFPRWAEGFLIYSATDSQCAVLHSYGIPDHIDLGSYPKQLKVAFLSVPPDLELTVVNLHYDYNQWLRQDQFDGFRQADDTLFDVTHAHTYEDSALDESCAQGFAAAAQGR